MRELLILAVHLLVAIARLSLVQDLTSACRGTPIGVFSLR
jgi:hypothetical protein